MNISIVYDSPDFVVINKPSGLLTHPRSESDKRPSVLSWFLEKYPEAKTVGEDLTRPGIVHRIDKETSGLLLLVKTQSAFKHFKRLFHDRLISKQYIALVYGNVEKDHGVIDAPLFKFGTRQSMRPPKEGKISERAALTEYAVLQRYTLHDSCYTLLEVMPRTGRTHQIRIHLRSIGHPIVGDPIYAPKSLLQVSGGLRLFLHAQKLSFTTPDLPGRQAGGQALTLEADMPDELTNFLKSATIQRP